MTKDKKLEKLLTIREAAEILNVHTETLRRWDRAGKLKAVRIGIRQGGGDRRYRKEDLTKYETQIKNLFDVLGFKTIATSQNKSGSQFGFDVGWDFYNDNFGTKLKWHVEVKTDNKESKTRPRITNKFYEKLFQSLSIEPIDFHCLCLVLPFIYLDNNELREFKNLNEKYIFPFTILVWDRNFLESNLPKVSPKLYREWYQKSADVKQDISVFVSEIKNCSNNGLFRNNLFNTKLNKIREQEEKNTHQLIVTRQTFKDKSFYKFEISSKKDNQQYLASKGEVEQKLIPVAKNIVFSEKKGVAQGEYIQKSSLIEVLKIAKNDKGTTLFAQMSNVIKKIAEFCIFRIETDEDIFRKSPFDQLNPSDFNQNKSINMTFFYEQSSDSLKVAKIKRINKVLSSGLETQEIEQIKDIIADHELRWYFMQKLPESISNLENFDFLWKNLFKEQRPFQLFKIFRSSINKSSYKYIIQFLQTHYKQLDKGGRDELFQDESIEIVQEILKKYPDSINVALSFIKYVLSLRENAYKNFDTKRDFERERKAILSLLKDLFSIYIQEENQEKVKEVIQLLDKHINLVSDDGKYSHDASPEAFQILRIYIESDFKNNFNEIVELLINQYKKHKWHKDKWSGWELVGSSISRSGSEYSISDRHFVTMTLAPSLEGYYRENPSEAWEFMVAKCITSKEEDIDSEHPDFLNRATLSILLEEYKKGKHSEEAFKILQDFVCMRNGIPHKTEIVFLAIYSNNPELSDGKKWALVKTQLDHEPYRGLPANVFVERITSDLSQKGDKDATKAVVSWPKSEEYRKRQRIGGVMVTENTWKLLDNEETFEDGLSSFKEYVFSVEFREKLETFEAWDVAKGLTKILEKKTGVGLQILNNIWNLPDLTDNQQIVICDSINSLHEENEKLLIEVFNKFLKAKLADLTIEEIEKKLSFNHARESLMKFAEKLAKKRKFEESLWLVEMFFHDSDPSKTGKNSKDDSKGEFNRHLQVLRGEDTMSIDTIRGWCAWVLQKFTIISGQQYLDKVIDLVEKLTKDGNYYVRLQACVPLIELTRTRYSVLPESKERFMTFEQAERVEKIAFNMLDEQENHKLYAVMKNLARVFTYMRSLPDEQAMYILNVFVKLNFPDTNEKDKDLLSGVMSEVSPLFIFYAEFRKDAFKNTKYKALYGEEFWKQLNKFSAKPFKDLLKDLLLNANDGVRANLAWQFWQLPKEKGIDFDKGFKIAYGYMQVLVRKYSHGVFEDVYHFVEDNFEDRPEECLVLWKKCLKKERPYFRKHLNDKNWHEMHWWPFFYNGKILKLVTEKEGDEEFLEWLEFLVDYPKRALIANDLDVAVEHLKTLPTDNKIVEGIFEKLVSRNAKYFDDMEEWKNK